MSQPDFAIQFQSTPQARPTALLATTDADEATVAFHAALHRLRTRGETGDVLVLRHTQGDERELLLRQPVVIPALCDERAQRRR